MLVDGFVAATWRLVRTKGQPSRLEVKALQPLTRAQDSEVVEEGTALAGFLALDGNLAEVHFISA